MRIAITLCGSGQREQVARARSEALEQVKDTQLGNTAPP